MTTTAYIIVRTNDYDSEDVVNVGGSLDRAKAEAQLVELQREESDRLAQRPAWTYGYEIQEVELV